jgi:KEOPS complex subunit Cgi121
MAEIFVGARGPPVEHVDMWMRQLQRAAFSRGFSAQALDAGAVCGRIHLDSAFLHARRAFEREKNLARTIWVEWVLCAAGVRQVAVAFERVGIRPGTDRFAILLLSEGSDPIAEDEVSSLLADLGLEQDDSVLECNEASLHRLGVGEGELAVVPKERWPDLALERTALLELER